MKALGKQADALWKMLDEMAAHTEGAPVRVAVNTHSDGDHWWGNAELPEDTTISDFVVGLATAQIKTGSLCRSERIVDSGSKRSMLKQV